MLQTAAITTAGPGRAARVATERVIAFPASWKPLVSEGEGQTDGRGPRPGPPLRPRPTPPGWTRGIIAWPTSEAPSPGADSADQPPGAGPCGLRAGGGQAASCCSTSGWSTEIGPTSAAPPGEPRPLTAGEKNSALMRA